MNRVIDKFTVAIDDLEPKIGKLERATALLVEYRTKRCSQPRNSGGRA